jgi:anti-sigma factor RsiW
MTQQLAHPVEELLPAYVAGSLGSDDIRAIEAHVAACEACRAELSEWELVHAASHVVAGTTPAPSRGVLDRALAKIEASAREPGWRERWTPRVLRPGRPRQSLAGIAAAVALGLAVAFTPIGSYAQGLLDVMRPQEFTVVPVTQEDIQALPSLDLYGEFAFAPGGEPVSSANAGDAGAATGMSVLTPTKFPATVTAPPAYVIVPSQSATFTFSAAKAQAAAAANGDRLPPMPANIDGSSMQMTTGTAVVALYGGSMMLGITGEASTPPPPSSAAGSMAEISSAVPQLVVAQMHAPVATSSGVSAEELERYLLSQPGISENLADAIRAISDPTTTWPIPVPAGEVRTRSVTVQGVRGTVFSDRSGFVAGVMWLKGGIIYAVIAPLGERDVLSVAESLR